MEYYKAVEKKLKLQGYSDEEIVVEIKKIMNPNIIMENEEDVVVVDEVNMPVVEEEVIEPAEEILEEAEEIEEEVAEEEVKVDTDEE